MEEEAAPRHGLSDEDSGDERSIDEQTVADCLAGYAHCHHFLVGLALPSISPTPRQSAGTLRPLSFPLLTRPDSTLSTLSAPLVDCVCSQLAYQSATASSGAYCALVSASLLRSVDQHLHVVYRWLREGSVETERPSLNCNAGVPVKDQPMAFYLSSHFKQTLPSPNPRHYTLWATASEYDWSERLIQPSFRRQQTTYKLAVEQSADMNAVMRGFEGSVLDIVHRLALVLLADGRINDPQFGVRRILPMSYFEVHSSLHTTPSTPLCPYRRALTSIRSLTALCDLMDWLASTFASTQPLSSWVGESPTQATTSTHNAALLFPS